MPIYEYDCLDCGERVSILYLTYADAETRPAVCPVCDGVNLQRRLVSRVSIVSGASGSDRGGGSAKKTIGNQDSATLSRMMREASDKAGGDLGSEFNEVATRLEKGESAVSVEKDIRKRMGKKRWVH